MESRHGIALGDNHRRGIGTAFFWFDRMLREVQEYAGGRELRSVFYGERNTPSQDQKRSLLTEIARMRDLLAELRDGLGLEAQVEDVARKIWGQSSTFQEVSYSWDAPSVSDTSMVPAPGTWLNRSVLAFGLTSFLSDLCHETATAILPQFMQAIGAPVAAFVLLRLAESHPPVLRTVLAWLPGLSAASGWAFRVIFLLTPVPGLLSVATLAFLVREKPHVQDHEMRFWGTIRTLPRAYRSFLLAVGLFGIADFAPTLMILRATTVLEPRLGPLQAAQTAALLYMLRNAVYAFVSFPIGALSDRFSRTRYLAVGYAVAVVTFLGFAFAVPAVWWFAVFFCLAGVFIAWEDTMEGVAVRDYVATEIAGTAYGVLGVVNGSGTSGPA